MYAYCGMAYDIDTGLDRSQAIRAIVRLARRRRKTGHEVTHTIGRTGLPEYEFSEPEGCALIPDTAGQAAVVAETRPAVECFECGDLVAIGEACVTCQEAAEYQAETNQL
jgi:hypothetical protein